LLDEPNAAKPQGKIVLTNSHILGQAFAMTFLAEWGDRSQIATIALAASFNPFMVTFGALLGHLICTMAAVKIGEWISGRVSEQKVLMAGGIVFVISGLFTAVIAIEEMMKRGA
jgi:putative Ca2+/H+ antiporter (TMEM165/GDT1 family)